MIVFGMVCSVVSILLSLCYYVQIICWMRNEEYKIAQAMKDIEEINEIICAKLDTMINVEREGHEEIMHRIEDL